MSVRQLVPRPYFYPRPHMEGDIGRSSSGSISNRFLPTPSHGGRLADGTIRFDTEIFLPTPSHGGRRMRGEEMGVTIWDFYPRPHMEGDRGKPYFYTSL